MFFEVVCRVILQVDLMQVEQLEEYLILQEAGLVGVNILHEALELLLGLVRLELEINL